MIAIISILAGLLLPALESAIKSARTLSCLSRLRQNHTALEMYRGDFGGLYPAFGGGLIWTGGTVKHWESKERMPFKIVGEGCLSYFTDYLRLDPSAGAVESRQAVYCPFRDWSEPMDPHWHRPSRVQWDGDFSGVASPGYNFYPGRYRIDALHSDVDTLTVHEDPNEILITDQVMGCTKDRAAEGIVTINGLVFNPHETKHCDLPLPVGGANQIVASGAATTFRLEDASVTFSLFGDGKPYAWAVTRSSSAGPKHRYFAQPD